jgi:hypothetical protein
VLVADAYERACDHVRRGCRNALAGQPAVEERAPQLLLEVEQAAEVDQLAPSLVHDVIEELARLGARHQRPGGPLLAATHGAPSIATCACPLA